jgi:hypothetical protein
MPTNPKSAIDKLTPLIKKLPAKPPASVNKNAYGAFMDAAKKIIATLEKSKSDGPMDKDLTDFSNAQKTVDTTRTKINAAVDAQAKDLSDLKKSDVSDLDKTWNVLYNALKDKGGKEEQSLVQAGGMFYMVAKQQVTDVTPASKV